MADVNNPRKGDTFYYLGRTQVTVIDETLKGGGVNMDEALVQVETKQGTPYLFLYKHSARYLSTKRSGFLESWPPKPTR